MSKLNWAKIKVQNQLNKNLYLGFEKKQELNYYMIKKCKKCKETKRIRWSDKKCRDCKKKKK